jgi:integrase/DNA-directed RNA polymerase subunit RPC12/RpoP
MSEQAPAEKPAFEIEAQNGLRCPECGSERLYKDGLRYLSNGQTVQRYLCRDCGYRFSWPRAERRNYYEAKNLKSQHAITYNGCSSRVLPLLERSVEGAMSEVEESEKRAAGATQPSQASQADIKGKLVEFAWWLKKQGYAEITITERCKLLKTLINRGANLMDPESVKEVIAKQKWSEGRKENAVDAYTSFLLMIGKTWQPPRYKRIEKLPFIPLEGEIDQLIAGCSFRTGVFLQLLKETGMRPGEAIRLEWTDIDPVNRTVKITPEKGSNPRILKISATLLERLNALPRKSSRVFGDIKLKSLQKRFQEQRRKIAAKLKNPRLLKITFTTLRHWKATMEYYKTKDILHVMKMLGHKNIKNTLIYTHLVNFEDNEFICKAAWTLEEASRLVEAGFEYVCDVEGAKLFRKRK